MPAGSRRPRWGQHFLRDPRILDRIASSLAFRPGDWVIEIGPGRGALTERLLSRGARVLAIEIDSQLVGVLNERFRGSDAFEVIHGDILEADLETLIRAKSDQGRIAVSGNLPYYITSPIVRRIFGVHEQVSAALLLVQKEVADRIVASKGSRQYAYLSVLCQLHAEAKLMFRVPARAFQPPPKVSSALVQLNMRPGAGPEAEFLDFLQLCFRQPRKMLRNNLSGAMSGAIDRAALGALEITRRRAQQLDVDELRQLWEELRPAQRSPAAALLDRP